MYKRQQQRFRLLLMWAVPLLSIGLTLLLFRFSPPLASVTGGLTYFLYTPANLWWQRRFLRKARAFDS